MHTFAKLSIRIRKPFIRMVNKPTPVTVSGPGKGKEVGNLLAMMDVKKALVITDRVLHKMGLLDGVLAGIKAAGIEAVVYDGVQPDPTFDVVSEAESYYTGCEALVAIGGGSVLDTAKAGGRRRGKPQAGG
jgi:alcohol dehydrogenase